MTPYSTSVYYYMSMAILDSLDATTYRPITSLLLYPGKLALNKLDTINDPVLQ